MKEVFFLKYRTLGHQVCNICHVRRTWESISMLCSWIIQKLLFRPSHGIKSSQREELSKSLSRTMRTPKAFATPATVTSECSGPMPPHINTCRTIIWKTLCLKKLAMFSHQRVQTYKIICRLARNIILLTNAYHIIYGLPSLYFLGYRIYLKLRGWDNQWELK